MLLDEYQPKRIFTIKEANATLPLVRVITRDYVELSRELTERRQRLSHLLVGREMEQGNPYSDELVQIDEELKKEKNRLQDYLQELRDLGVEPKGGLEGLVDFPAMLDDKLVFLCWKLDEPEILYWHDLDAGVAGREPLTVDTADHRRSHEFDL